MQGAQLAFVAVGLLTIYGRNLETDGGGRIYLTAQNFKNAEKIPLYGLPEDVIDALESAESSSERIVYTKRNPVRIRRKRLVEKGSRWPNGVVPYEIVGKFNPDQLDIIAKAISEFHKKTCIKWVPYTNQKQFVTMFSPKRYQCWADVGKLKKYILPKSGQQHIALGFKRGSNTVEDSCVYPGTVIHEMMHTIGFHHEMSRPDRKKYIKVLKNNIAKNYRFQYIIEKNVDTLGLPYDYASVMHYSQYVGSKNGQPSFIALRNNKGITIGKQNGFSKLDLKKINKHYRCKSKGHKGKPKSKPRSKKI